MQTCLHLHVHGSVYSVIGNVQALSALLCTFKAAKEEGVSVERTRSIRGLPEKFLHLEDPVVNGSIHSTVLVGQGRVGMVKIMIIDRAISTIISHPVSIRHVSNTLHTERISIGPSEYSIASGASATDRPLATTTPHNLFTSNLSFSYKVITGYSCRSWNRINFMKK